MTCSRAPLPPSYTECRRVARRAASSFYPCFFLLRQPRRRAIEALYAFMRHTDDLADARGVKDRAAALQDWRGGLEAAIAGKIVRPAGPAQKILVAVADTAEWFQIPHRHLFDVIGGVAMDLQPRRYATFEELAGYCDLVAGAVGRDERGGKGHQQTTGHPAVGAGHIVRRSHGGLCITAIIIVVIHVEVPPFLFRRGCGGLAALAPVYGI